MAANTAMRAVPRQRPDFVLSLGAGGHRLTDPATGAVHVLNETALALWELCDGRTTPAEMVAAVEALFSCGRDVAERDVNRTLVEFDRAGLITWAQPPRGDRNEQATGDADA
jgi:hypothetical protein